MQKPAACSAQTYIIVGIDRHSVCIYRQLSWRGILFSAGLHAFDHFTFKGFRAGGQVLSNEFFQILGQRSYSIYLTHWSFLIFFTSLIQREVWWLSTCVLAIFLPLVYVSAGITYKYVEDPWRRRFNRWSDKLDERQSSTATAIPQAFSK